MIPYRCPPSPVVRRIVLSVSVVLAVCGEWASLCFGDDFRRKTKFWAQLNAPMTAVLDGVPFREALERICDPVEINVCLDRHVDPSAAVMSGTVGPTIYSALDKLARQHDCVVMPVCNVVLVGRPKWVDATSAALLAITAQESADDASIEISWPDLTTGRKAFAIAMGKQSADLNDVALPHDLWPKQKWSQIDRRVAVALVLAQFDLQLGQAIDSSTSEIVAKPLSGLGSWDRTYSSDTKSSLVGRVIKQNDSESQSLTDDDSLIIKANSKAHRIATDTLLHEFAKLAASKAKDDTKTFSVRRTETSAGAALTQFAQASGRRCVIESSAIQSCQKRITLEAKDETLKSLINRIAQQADVLVQWYDDKIVVKKK